MNLETFGLAAVVVLDELTLNPMSAICDPCARVGATVDVDGDRGRRACR